MNSSLRPDGPSADPHAETAALGQIGSALPPHDRITAVFMGDLRKWSTNPFHADTPFGRPQALSIGDVFEERDALEAALDAAVASLQQAQLELTEAGNIFRPNMPALARLYDDAARRVGRAIDATSQATASAAANKKPEAPEVIP